MYLPVLHLCDVITTTTSRTGQYVVNGLSHYDKLLRLILLDPSSRNITGFDYALAPTHSRLARIQREADMFLSRSAVPERDFCPSVCLSHAGSASKLMTVGLRGFHRRVSQGLSFWDQLLYGQGEQSFPGLQTGVGWEKRQKNANFRPLLCNISETVEDKDLAYYWSLAGSRIRAFDWY